MIDLNSAYTPHTRLGFITSLYVLSLLTCQFCK